MKRDIRFCATLVAAMLGPSLARADCTEQGLNKPRSGIVAVQAPGGLPQERRHNDILTKELPARDDQTRPNPETTAGWVKYDGNPVLGGKLGTCFDISVLKQGDTYRMWFSWRPKRSVALVESNDGIHWSEPLIVLGPRKQSGWEDEVNRPVVLQRGDGYHMWYTGQVKPGQPDGHSWIGYATSADGKTWKRMSEKPVLSPQRPWEKVAVMCPHVIWDNGTGLFRMWYSGGEQYEPDGIGYATSRDGLTWTKREDNPVFKADPNTAWERHKVTGCQVVQQGDWHVMFYIGFRDVDHAQIGVARSKDGITHWQRHPANPIVRPGKETWDHDACYKPYAIFDGKKWLLWYNGRHGGSEQIGLALHEGEGLGFPAFPAGNATPPPSVSLAAPKGSASAVLKAQALNDWRPTEK
jgi:predicted GH43/DUF377 family glycosyl hydrolase